MSRHLSLLLVPAVLAVTAPAARGQITPQDSAAIWARTLESLGGEASLVLSNARPLWVRGVRVAYEDQMVLEPLSPAVWSAFLEQFPNAVQVPADEVLFECPPGREVRMPGSGCPIRDGGRVAVLLPITPEGTDGASAAASVTSSNPSGDRSRRVGIGIELRRTGAGWTFVQTRWLEIT
jgi:hypothetical protein